MCLSAQLFIYYLSVSQPMYPSLYISVYPSFSGKSWSWGKEILFNPPSIPPQCCGILIVTVVIPIILYCCGIRYKVVHLKSNSTYKYMCKLWWHPYNRAGICFPCCCLLGRTYRTALQPVYCCLIPCILVSISIAKRFTNSSRHFRCEVLFENRHTFRSWIHHVRTCTAFVQALWSEA
jgi:hypothetical protein